MIRVLPLILCLIGMMSSLWCPRAANASPGLCTGPVCADDITRSAKNHWQLVLKLNDQQGHRDRQQGTQGTQDLGPEEQ